QLRPFVTMSTKSKDTPGSTLTIADTALRPAASEGATIRGEAEVVKEPLFGMHNRDYPSLWAARRLLAYLDEGAITFEEFVQRATEEAWAFAAELRALEIELGTKLTALFPTNLDKREAASGAFRAFALG